MLTGEIRNQVDQVWNAFWSGGVSNPLSVIEQITFLLFIKRLDDLHTLEENKANTLGKPIERRIFPEGKDEKGEPYEHLRWSHFKNAEAREMMRIVDEHVFPFLREMGEGNATYGKHMKDARLGFSNASLLTKVVELIDAIPMDDRDTKGDLYEYMLGKIASAGQNGQFRTPRHIIQLMVELTEPTPQDTICDPASGTCGFLVAAGEYLRDNHPKMLRDKEARAHFHTGMFHGFDFDATMLRIGAMNMILHGIEGANIADRDSLAEEHGADEGTYSLVLANPPFAGSLDYDSTAKDLQKIVKTKKTELPSSCACFGPEGARRLLCRTGCCLAAQRHTKKSAGCWSKIISWMRWSSCPRACSAPMPGSRPRSCSSPRPAWAAPRMSGSMTCRRTGILWMISARR